MARKGENIHKRKDGRWEARVIIHRDFSKKAIYKSIYGKTYLEAKHKKETILKNLSLSQSSNSGENILFESVIVLWLSHVKMKVKPKTYEKYYFLIKKHILPALGNMKLKEFDTQTINKFIYEKSKNGRLDNNGGLSANYIRTITFVITSVIQYINTEKIYPISLGKISLPQKPQSEVQVLSRYEQFKLEEYIQHHKTDRTLGILFSLYTGIRLGELCALTWDDIDFENSRGNDASLLDAFNKPIHILIIINLIGVLWKIINFGERNVVNLFEICFITLLLGGEQTIY